MVYRYSRLIGIAAVAFALLRLGRLLRPVESGPPWQMVLLAAFALGAVVTWLIVTYRYGSLTVIAANLIGFLLATIRIAAPGTARFGIVPTAETGAVLSEELAFAVELIRFGSAPVLPVRGLVLVIAAVFWALGALLVWGLATQKPGVALLPVLLFHLQLATIDRIPTPTSWLVFFLLLVAGALAAMVIDERRSGAGRLRTDSGSFKGRTALGAPGIFIVGLVAGSLFVGTVLGDFVPPSGVLEWRSRSGLGGGIYGGVSYNLFVSTVQSDLLALGDEPVFVAAVPENVDSSQLYWKLVTLETYDGTNWYPGNLPFTRPAGTEGWERPDFTYRGETQTIDQVIQIRSLRMNYLPALYSPTALASENTILSESFSVRQDGSLRFDARTFEGLTYTVQSEVPADTPAMLASTNGVFSRMFRNAASAGAFAGTAIRKSAEPRPAGIDALTELPGGLDGRIATLARELVVNADTPYEQALLIEAFYRDRNVFDYSVDIDAGHTATNLSDWLFDPESPNYRTGYCEQFATGMAVMTRSLGLPTRVVLGFTPGEANEDGLVIVRQRNAHAWVEVWLDAHGWVRFDPTPRSDGINPSASGELAFDPGDFSLPPDVSVDEAFADGFTPDGRDPRLELLDRINDAPFEGSLEPLPTTPTDQPLTVPSYLWLLVAAAAVAIALPSYKLLRRRRRLARLRDGEIAAAWEEIVDRLADLRSPVEPDETPLEAARRSGVPLEPLAVSYARAIYGPEGPLPTAVLERGTTGFRATEEALKERYPRGRRAAAWWSVRSLRFRRPS